MRQLLISVRDSKAEFFSPPMLVRTRGEAIRSFSDAVNEPSHQFHGHADDFSLFQIGSMDILTGVITPELAPLLVVSGFDVLAQPGVRLEAAR